MSGQWRIYLKPFDSFGVYTSWVDVSSYVKWSSLGSIAVNLDNTDYDIGVYRNSNVKLVFDNTKGLFSDVSSPKSIFQYKRADTLCKITYRRNPTTILGTTRAGFGSFLGDEIEVFTGLLNDDSLAMSLKTQEVDFNVLGREFVFLRTIVPFGTVTNGENLSLTLYKILNQSAITTLFSVQQENITVGLDQTNDSLASIQNKTVQEGLNKLLLATNSVLVIENDTLYIKPRTATVDTKFNFFGQASRIGPENVVAIDKIKNGVAKVYNYFVWAGTTLAVSDNNSSVLYGARKQELDFEFLTNTTKRQNVMNAILAEFKTPKQEFDLLTKLTPETLAIKLLDRVTIDYPTVYLKTQDPLPVCGIAVCGSAKLPSAQWSFTLEQDEPYKIMGRSVSAQSGEITFKMRCV